MARPEVLKEGKFECAGQGLMVAGHKRASVAEIKRTLSGKIVKTTSKKKTAEKVEKQPKSWWEAQVRLYGLNCDKWTIGNMQAILDVAVQTRTLQVPHDVQALEKKLSKMYENWDNIEEMSSDDGDDSEIVTPDDSMVSDSGTKTGNRATDTRREKEKLGRAAVKRTIAKLNRDHSLLLLSKEGGGDDVFGTWQIHCPGIHEEWPDWEGIEKGLKWIIHPLLAGNTHSWVSFNQLVVEGVMGIEWRENDLPRKDWFNWLNVKRQFRFRGRETGEYDFCCEDDANMGWIIFTSEHECHGVFEVEFGGEPWEFTGKKVSLKRPGKKPAALAKEYEKLGREYHKKTCIW